MNLSGKLTTCSTELIEANGWGELVQRGIFEPDKALMSLQATTKEYLSSLSHQTIEDIVKIPTVSLATLKKYRGESKMVVTLCALILKVSEMLNVGKSMSDVQIQETAKMIFSDYHYFTLGDFKVCFANGIKCKYGQLFDRFDASVIFEWLAKYADERAEYFEIKCQNDSERLKSLEDTMPMPDGFMEKIEQIVAKSKRAIPALSNSKPVKFSTLASFLESIGRNNDESQNVILDAWRNEFKTADIEIELDSFLLYKSSQMLNLVNVGKISSWEDVVLFLK